MRIEKIGDIPQARMLAILSDKSRTVVYANMIEIYANQNAALLHLQVNSDLIRTNDFANEAAATFLTLNAMQQLCELEVEDAEMEKIDKACEDFCQNVTLEVLSTTCIEKLNSIMRRLAKRIRKTLEVNEQEHLSEDVFYLERYLTRLCDMLSITEEDINSYIKIHLGME